MAAVSRMAPIKFVLLCAALALSVQTASAVSFAKFQASSTSVAAPQWNDLFVGGGGFETGIQFAADGTALVRSDTSPGIWLCQATPCKNTSWFPINNPASNADLGPNTAGGIMEMAIAPSNTSVFAMVFNGFVYITSNKGQSWTKEANFSQITINPNDDTKFLSPNMAFDPNNDNILYVSSPSAGLFKTTSALSPGSATWTQVTAVGAGTTPTAVGSFSGGSQGGGHLIVFDTVSSGCTTPVGGVSQCIYVSTWGTGWYHSANGGTSWTAISNSAICSGTTCPFTHYAATIDQNGKLWTTDFTNASENLWTYAGTTWTRVISVGSTVISQPAWVAIDPANASNVIIMSAGAYCLTSSNGAASWNNIGGGVNGGPITATDAPWQATSSWTYISGGGVTFDPSQSSTLYVSTGETVIYSAPFTSTSTINWTTQVSGIETLDGQNIRASANGTVFGMASDYPLWPITPGTHPSKYGVNYLGVTVALDRGLSLDYAPDNSNFICYVVDQEGTELSGCSNNNGSTWPTFSTFPFGGTGGQILVVDASGPDIVWMQQAEPPAWTQTSSGTSWTTSTDGTKAFGDAPCGASPCHSMSLDSNGKLWLFNYNSGSNTEATGLWFSTNKGQSFTACGVNDPSSFGGALSSLAAIPNSGATPVIFFTPGLHFVAQPDTAALLYHTTGCGSWTQDTNWKSVYALGTGAPCSGHTNGSLYVAGWYNGTAATNYGVYESCDEGVTYTQLGSNAGCTVSTLSQCNVPMGNWAGIDGIDGDKNTPGQVYISFDNGGFAYWH